MAKEKRPADPREEQRGKSTSDYYKLKTDAVNRLVTASEETAPEVSEEELRKYTKKGRFSLPTWLKVFFVKFWFNGAVCYFFFWGLGTYITATLDMLFVVGFAMGCITDLLVNNIFHYFEKEPGFYDRWIMIPKRKWWTIFPNIVYAYLILFFVVGAYSVLNYLVLKNSADGTAIAVGVEPTLFGLFYLGFDMLFVGMRNLFGRIVSDAEKKAGRH